MLPPACRAACKYIAKRSRREGADGTTMSGMGRPLGVGQPALRRGAVVVRRVFAIFAAVASAHDLV